MSKVNILGVYVSKLNKTKTMEVVRGFLLSKNQHQIVTPNPEFILATREDEEFYFIINRADLAIPDGVGLKIAAGLIGQRIHRITGADLIKDILKLAEQENRKVAIIFYNGALSKADDINKALRKKYPNLQFVALEAERAWEKFNPDKINNFKPDIVFTTLGAPYQDKFIYHNLKKIPSAKIGMGVGGAFDFLTGKMQRAPKWLRLIGLEWLWRLLLEPKRWKRIYNAVLVFSYEFIKWKYFLPFFYRSNVACLLFKTENDRKKILIVKREELADHWQLPQGGTDGESLADAGAREIREELGTDKFRVVKIFKNVFKYKFGAGVRKSEPKKHLGYKGQKQGLCTLEFTGVDEDIKLNFWDHEEWKWVDSDRLIYEVHPMRAEATKRFLEKFNSST